MAWLRGGPILEISFLLPLGEDRRRFVDNLLVTFQSFTPVVELAASEEEVAEIIAAFDRGYPDDEDDPESKVSHSIQLPVYVHTDGKRKAVLSLQQLSGQLAAVDFWFFASVWDAPEWNQRGITKSQLPIFGNLLHRLFDAFDYIIGTMSYEYSVTNLFDRAGSWPDESYHPDNIKKQLLLGDHHFILIIANKKHIDLTDRNELRTDGQKQILEAKEEVYKNASTKAGLMRRLIQYWFNKSGLV